MKSKRLHDHIYLKENRYKKTKEMFKFIDKHAFKINQRNYKEEVCDIGCAAGEFLYFLKGKYPSKFFTGADVRQDLLTKAKRIVKNINLKKGSVLKKNLFKKSKFDKIFMIGVHPIFDNFEGCFSNLIFWGKPRAEIFICDMFNPYPVDVLIRYKLSKNYKSKTHETGWNIFSEKSVAKFLKNNKKVKSFYFKKFEMPFDLKPQKDPIRSWTIKSNGKRLMINGISIIQPQTLLKIKLKDF